MAVGLGTVGEFAIGEAQSIVVSVPTLTGWAQQLSQPLHALPGLRASEQQFLALTPPQVVSFSWVYPWHDPVVRTKPSLKQALQQVLAFQPSPSPFVATGWYSWLSEPPRLKIKPRLLAGEHPFLAFQPAPSPFVATGWYSPLSEPPRFPRRLVQALQQALAFTSPIPRAEDFVAWFNWFSEPPRFKPNLGADRQSDFTAPPRLLPTPDVFVDIDAVEAPDTALIAIGLFNRAVSARVSIEELVPGRATLSIEESDLDVANVSLREP